MEPSMRETGMHTGYLSSWTNPLREAKGPGLFLFKAVEKISGRSIAGRELYHQLLGIFAGYE
ncbi:MAG: hypothetical protein K2H94_10385, partial [Duncaniella sp.]|nr:hypothetical protein [Duncaniella sp.]